MSTPILEAHGLEVGYGHRAILPPLDLQLAPEETWALVGRNGGGKSTLLRTLLGLLPPLGGALERRPGSVLSYVPQRGDYDLSVPARVIDFVRGGADRGWSFLRPGWLRAQRGAVEEAVESTNIGALLRRPFGELSEGQKQRVLIARALVARPDLMILDEPTSAMDPLAERAIFQLLAELRQRRGLTVVMASHQMSFIPDFASHAIFVDSDEGVMEVGTARAIASNQHFLHHFGECPFDGHREAR